MKLGNIDRRAAADPDGIALADDERELTWRDLAAEVQAAIALFASLAVEPGQRIGVLGENRVETMIPHTAGILSGVGTIALSRQLTGPELCDQLADAGRSRRRCRPQQPPGSPSRGGTGSGGGHRPWQSRLPSRMAVMGSRDGSAAAAGGRRLCCQPGPLPAHRLHLRDNRPRARHRSSAAPAAVRHRRGLRTGTGRQAKLPWPGRT